MRRYEQASLGALLALPRYLANWALPVTGIMMISAQVAVNFILDVVVASHLLRFSGPAARRRGAQ